MSCMPAAFDGFVIHEPVSSWIRKSSTDAHLYGSMVAPERTQEIVDSPSPGDGVHPLRARMVVCVLESQEWTRSRDRVSIQVMRLASPSPSSCSTGRTERGNWCRTIEGGHTSSTGRGECIPDG